MDTFRKLLLAFGALGVVMVLAAGPALATEAGGAGGAGADGGTETVTEEDLPEPAGGVVVRGEDGKMQLPLDPERPRDAVGWGLIGVTALAILLGLVNARKQLRGERGQATGEWRYR